VRSAAPLLSEKDKHTDSQPAKPPPPRPRPARQLTIHVAGKRVFVAIATLDGLRV
jgi:hypothetical protein